LHAALTLRLYRAVLMDPFVPLLLRVSTFLVWLKAPFWRIPGRGADADYSLMEGTDDGSLYGVGLFEI